MTTTRFFNPRPQFLLADGSLLPNGKMAFKESGTDIDKDTFSDVNEQNKNDNPLDLNADGTMPNCFYAGTARVILTFNAGAGEQQRFDLDGVGMFGSGAAFDIWNSIIEYEDGAIVEASDGEYYRSLQNNNIGNDPTVSPTFWEQINFIRTYNANVTYGTDAIVIASNGLIFRSLQAANLNNDPLTSPTFWGTPVAFVDLNILGDLSFASTELTIAAGSVTAETSHHTIDTQSDAATDDLDTIAVANVADFTLLFLRLENAARVVTLKDNTGNIQTKNNEDIVLDANIPTVLFRVGTDWFEVQRPVVDNPFDQDLNTTDDPTFGEITATTGINLGGVAAANLLDDYEEGTFTAGLSCGTSGTITLDSTIDLMSYTKEGNTVHIRGAILVDSVSSPLGALRLTGLPFTSANFAELAERAGSYVACGGLASAVHVLQGRVINSSTEIIIEEFTGTTGVDDVCNHIQAGTIFTFGFSYPST